MLKEVITYITETQRLTLDGFELAEHQTQLQLVLWMVRGIAPMVVILRAGPDQQLLLACVRHHAHTSAEQHHGLLMHRRAPLRPATGPALTLPRHCELSAADGTTSA